MISFYQKDTTVFARIDGPLDYQFSFTWRENANHAAYLLMRYLRNALYRRVENMRREEYNRGWHDAKSKKVRKATWFSGKF